jgi:hypothetical protein
VFAAMLLAYQLRFGHLIPTPDFWLVLTTPLITLAIYLCLRLYRAHQYSTAEEFRPIIVSISLIISVIVTVSFWSKVSFSRLWVLLSWGLGLVLALSSRRLWHWRVRRLRLQGRLTFRTLIVGTNNEAKRLAANAETKELGFLPMGFVLGSTETMPRDDTAVVGPIDRLRDLIRGTRADCLFVASSAVTPEDAVLIMKARRLEDIEVRFTANLPAILSTRLAPETIGGVMAPFRKCAAAHPFPGRRQTRLRRARSSLGLLRLVPLFGAVALAIKLTSRGPVIFRQQRIGLRGRPFTLLKFRTMVVGADLLDRLLEQSGRAAVQAPPRPQGHPDRALPAPLQPRRVAATRERTPGRDKPGRAAAATGRGGRALRGVAAGPARGATGHHRPVAGQRAQRAILRGLHTPRPLLRRELVDRRRPVHPVQDPPAADLGSGAY